MLRTPAAARAAPAAGRGPPALQGQWCDGAGMAGGWASKRCRERHWQPARTAAQLATAVYLARRQATRLFVEHNHCKLGVCCPGRLHLSCTPLRGSRRQLEAGQGCAQCSERRRARLSPHQLSQRRQGGQAAAFIQTKVSGRVATFEPGEAGQLLLRPSGCRPLRRLVMGEEGLAVPQADAAQARAVVQTPLPCLRYVLHQLQLRQGRQAGQGAALLCRVAGVGQLQPLQA